MPEKRVLDRERLRRVPEQFSWVDQRLVRHEYVRLMFPLLRYINT
jgi:hypothetical protein